MSFAGKFDDAQPVGEGSHLGGYLHVDSVSSHAPSGAIVVPDAHLLFTGDFRRSGVDLILSGDDRELVLHDYFKGEKRAALSSPDGAHLTGDIVNALTGHTQFAQADGSPGVAQVIGHVTKLVGTATAIRNGVSIILNQGDNVNKGDVVQSGSESSLGITFIDGSVFGLASNAKMVLNEMVYDPNGSSNSSLLSLVQGTISFVAGATAKHGDMKVDTPVATMGIRGTAVLVEIDFEVPGQGSAPPAKFQVLVEPDGTTGSYILFDKTTLTPIATVNQAGTQTIVNGQGTVNFLSSVQLSPDAQKIITDVFALKFTDLTNPQSNTKFTDSIVPETVFVKTAAGDTVAVTVQVAHVGDSSGPSVPTSPLNRVDHVAGGPTVVTFDAGLTESVGLTASSVSDTVSGQIRFADVNPGDTPTVTAAFNSFSYHNAQHADVTGSLSAAQIAAITAVEVPLSMVQNPGNANTGAATWTFSVADKAFDFLAAGETLTLTYQARVDNNFSLNNETTNQTFNITITGTNDAPSVAAVNAGTATKSGSTGNFGNLTGSLVGYDPDHDETALLLYSAVDPISHGAVNTAIAGHYGALTVNANGGYSYVVNASVANALPFDTYVDTFTVQTTDVHGASGTAVLTVNVVGAGVVTPHVLAAGLNTNSLGLLTISFDGIEAGSVSNNGAGSGNFLDAALGATFSSTGNAGIVNGSSGVSGAPFIGPSPGHADDTNYLSIGAGGTETITFASHQNAFGLYWGSVDPYNTLKFYDGLTLVASYTGADISPLFATGNQGSFNANGYVEFSGLHSFDKVVLGSTSNAFEVDNISAGTVPSFQAGLSATGNATDVSAFSAVNGTSGDDIFSNAGGDVTIFGRGGHDTFVFNADFGRATIADFDVNNDKIEISHLLFGSVADILAAAASASSGQDTVITDAAHDMITLKGVTVSQLQSFDFHLF